MNKDDFDLYQHLSRSPKNNGAAEFIRGLQVRELGNGKRKVNTKEDIQQYAEDQFIRKERFSEMRCEMPGAPRSTFLMVFSPDGRRAASTHGNHNIYVTDLRSGKNIKTLVGHPRTPWCIAFHPTSDQIVASGCLGGQVRIWDLSGSSEVWTTSSNSVIASIAFHPNDRVLVIATFNEVYFWDWSQPKPFVHVATSNPKEKVRYVAFDKLGHKLITGIANSPQTRWERVRAPVPVPRQERCASPYRRRITQRLVVNPSTAHEQQPTSSQDLPPEGRTSHSPVPERERRIALCYRNLVREYENLVQRYIQLYLPPTMIDRGTDPMEPSHYNSGTQTAGPSNVDASTPSCSRNSNESATAAPSTTNTTNDEDPQPSTSQQSQNLITPSRMFVVGPKPPSFIKGTQTTESRKHKTDATATGNTCEKRLKRSHNNPDSSDSGSSDSSDGSADPNRSAAAAAAASNEIAQNNRVLVVNLNRLNADRLDSSSSVNNSQVQSTSTSERPTSSASRSTTRDSLPGLNLPSIFHYDNVRPPEQSDAAGRSSRANHRERFEQYVRANRERILEFQRRNVSLRNRASQEDTERNDAMPPSSSRYDHLYGGTTQADREIEVNFTDSNQQVSQNNSEELLTSMRRNAVQEVRNRMLPILRSVPPNDRAELIRLFGNSRESARPRNRQGHVRRHNRRTLRIDSSTDTSSSDTEPDQANRSGTSELIGHQFASTPLDLSLNRSSGTDSLPSLIPSREASTVGTAPTNPVGERNFNTELEQLVTSLLIEIERTESGQNRPANVNTNSDSARTRPCRPRSPFPSLRQPPGESIENLMQPRARPSRPDCGPTRRHDNGLPSRAASCRSLFPHQEPRGAHLSPYQPYNRVRFFSRVSAFMPTRVSYTRARMRRSPNRYPYGSGRSGIHRSPFRAASVMLDELVNYGARENSEGEPPQAPRSSSPSPHNSQNVDSIRSMYSYIIQDLELSLSDVHHLRSSNRPGETSDMLSNFSQRLENILTQSEAILTSLRRSVERQPNPGGAENGSTGTSENDLRWNYNDPGFYVRDLRSEGSSGVTTSRAALQNLIGSLGAVASDHTYPRNPNNPSTSDNMNSVHLAISHIQEQTRMLRRQVDSVERIDRALVEVSQLSLIRQLIVGMVGHVRLRSGEGGHAGVSSVRQMMAGTRISDSSPYDSPNEETNASRPTQRWANASNDQPDTSPGTSNASNDQPGPSSGNSPANQRRGNSRKTYPPSKFSRRHQARPLLLHWFHRRFPNQTLMHNRNPASRPTSQPQSFHNAQTLFNYSNINPSTLGLMTRRLERLLTEQMRVFNRSSNIPQESRSATSVDLGEHILALRLHGCLLRINRVLGQRIDFSGVRNLREPAASPEGAGRYAARHTLSLIVDGMSRYIEELGPNNMAPRTRLQVLSVLAMSILLTDLLLLQVVESVPSPTDVNLDPESEALVRRIDDMCLRILQNRFMGIPGLLSRSLRLMRLTLRRAHRVLDSTYLNLRNGMTARHEPDRARLIGNINRCLRALNRQPAGSGGGYFRWTNPNLPSTSSGTGAIDDMFDDDFYQVIDDLISYYSENREDERLESTDDRRPVDNVEDDLLSSNDNSDDEPEGPHGAWGYYSSRHLLRHNNSLYRTNNVNLVMPPSRPEPSSPASPSGSVPWNVPMVQVNDEPVLEPPFTAHRPMPRSVYADRHRETYAERLSELRTHSRMGLFRPRFLHPLYASVNPFDADLDDSREHIYDSDMITTVTPNHRIQAWDFSHGFVPPISNPIKNVVVNECKIHNDASVDISSDGTILVTLLPSGGYLNVTNRLGVYSLRWETLGQCLYTTSFEQNAVSVSLSPLSRHLVVGFVSRRVSIAPNDRWIMARIYRIEQKDVPGDRLPILKELEQHRENRINCIRWLPMSGQGLIYATNTGQLVVLS